MSESPSCALARSRFQVVLSITKDPSGTRAGRASLLRRKGPLVQSKRDLRTRKKQAVRQALESAALKLFDEQGFAATTIDQIADAADVSRSTFFRYFGSKEAVLFSGYDEVGEAFAELILERPSEETPLVAFARAFVELARAQAKDSDREDGERRARIYEADPVLHARSRDVTRRWTERIAVILAQRDGLEQPRREHLLAATVGIAVAERVADEYTDPNSSPRGPDEIVSEMFALLKELVI